jgi:DNA-binding response OmpR family regulator
MYHFLIVEDMPEDGEMYRQWLQSAWSDAHILVAATTTAALTACRSEKFDVVITDIDMGQGDDRVGGITVANELQNTETPVIVITGLSQADIYRRVVFALGAWDFLQKPVVVDDFVHQVRRALTYARPIQAVLAPQVPVGPQLTRDPDLMRAFRGDTPVTWKGRRVTLTLTHIRLLDALLEGNGKPVPHDVLVSELISGKNVLNLREHIKMLRQAFKDVDASCFKLRGCKTH